MIQYLEIKRWFKDQNILKKLSILTVKSPKIKSHILNLGECVGELIVFL